MSSGFHQLASIEIENGHVVVDEVSGEFSPSSDKSFRLRLSFMEQDAGQGNVHPEPHRRDTSVFLTYAEFEDLVQKLEDYKAAVSTDTEAHGRALDEFITARDSIAVATS